MYSSQKYNKPGAIILEGHIQGLSNTRSLGEKGIPVFVVDKTDCIARHSKYCIKFFNCPDFIEDAFANFLLELAEEEMIKDWVLIPSNDHAVYTISKHKSRLEKVYKIITPSIEILENIYDKLKLLKIAELNGVPVPITQTFQSPEDKIDSRLHFPVLIKGRHGLSFFKAFKKKVFIIKNENELREQLSFINEKYSITKTFTQELIPYKKNVKTISFTAFCIKGEIKTYWMGEKLREHPHRFGTATFARSMYEENCLQQSIPLLKALNYTGVCEIEFLQDPRNKEFKLIEINARTWLWVSLAKHCGIDYAQYIYNYTNSINCNYPVNYINNLYWVNPISDLIFGIWGIFKGEINPVNYIMGKLKGIHVNALFIKHDFKPGIIYLKNLFMYLKSR